MWTGEQVAQALCGASIERVDGKGLMINEVYFPFTSTGSATAGSTGEADSSDDFPADGDAAAPVYVVGVGANQQRDLDFHGSFTGQDLQISSESVGLEGTNFVSPTRNGQPVVLSGVSTDAEIKARQAESFSPLPVPFQVSSDGADETSEVPHVVVASVMPAGRVVPPLPAAHCRDFRTSPTWRMLVLCLALGLLVFGFREGGGCGLVLPDVTTALYYVWISAVHIQGLLLRVGPAVLDIWVLGGLCACLTWVARRLGRMCFVYRADSVPPDTESVPRRERVRPDTRQVSCRLPSSQALFRHPSKRMWRAGCVHPACCVVSATEVVVPTHRADTSTATAPSQVVGLLSPGAHFGSVARSARDAGVCECYVPAPVCFYAAG